MIHDSTAFYLKVEESHTLNSGSEAFPNFQKGIFIKQYFLIIIKGEKIKTDSWLVL